jgi:hypothetical protein
VAVFRSSRWTKKTVPLLGRRCREGPLGGLGAGGRYWWTTSRLVHLPHFRGVRRRGPCATLPGPGRQPRLEAETRGLCASVRAAPVAAGGGPGGRG